jgi:hypothetical protein
MPLDRVEAAASFQRILRATRGTPDVEHRARSINWLENQGISEHVIYARLHLLF